MFVVVYVSLRFFVSFLVERVEPFIHYGIYIEIRDVRIVCEGLWLMQPHYFV